MRIAIKNNSVQEESQIKQELFKKLQKTPINNHQHTSMHITALLITIQLFSTHR
ncbi:hypothetical protein HMPREF1584_01000 [Gardnerella vaginalis JCP8481A]|uniref:Uncharacterized protein n=1 Tax=Gardnerella vaginalis TaxID=2702 RepID=A0A133NTR9_GARVA|nr:hypothetical protein HMPREF1584_01000 [Gardnerella vaginalis JCP8481A]EPI44267.1 hypothetical protein HMPREF1585_00146 [Gardnerella vaginalis JCP8481B]KXA19676.1 hypothetical protein HMPREF3208_01025 [Gardnerella vaginalis]